jgi:hypothetical protein
MKRTFVFFLIAVAVVALIYANQTAIAPLSRVRADDGVICINASTDEPICDPSIEHATPTPTYDLHLPIVSKGVTP